MTTFTILPTGTCFDDVVEWLEHHGSRLDDATLLRHRICHGLCKGYDIGSEPGPHAPYAHAWILDADGHIIDFGIHSETNTKLIVQCNAAEFYAHRRVEHEIRYTLREAATASHLCGGSGPWRANLLALTSDGRRARFPAVVARLGTYIDHRR